MAYFVNNYNQTFARNVNPPFGAREVELDQFKASIGQYNNPLGIKQIKTTELSTSAIKMEPSKDNERRRWAKAKMDDRTTKQVVPKLDLSKLNQHSSPGMKYSLFAGLNGVAESNRDHLYYESSRGRENASPNINSLRIVSIDDDDFDVETVGDYDDLYSETNAGEPDDDDDTCSIQTGISNFTRATGWSLGSYQAGYYPGPRRSQLQSTQSQTTENDASKPLSMVKETKNAWEQDVQEEEATKKQIESKKTIVEEEYSDTKSRRKLNRTEHRERKSRRTQRTNIDSNNEVETQRSRRVRTKSRRMKSKNNEGDVIAVTASPIANSVYASKINTRLLDYGDDDTIVIDDAHHKAVYKKDLDLIVNVVPDQAAGMPSKRSSSNTGSAFKGRMLHSVSQTSIMNPLISTSSLQTIVNNSKIRNNNSSINMAHTMSVVPLPLQNIEPIIRSSNVDNNGLNSPVQRHLTGQVKPKPLGLVLAMPKNANQVGLVVTQLNARPAKEAGFLVNDVLLQVNGCDINNPGDLAQALKRLNNGCEVRCKVERGMKKIMLTMYR